MRSSRTTALRLFSLGYLTLFLELALIRHLAGNIWNFGYFPNLVLLSVFIGMGIGFTFHHVVADRLSNIVFHVAIWLLFLLVAYVYFEHPSVPGFTTWAGNMSGEVYFTAVPKQAVAKSFLPFFVCMVLIVLVFALVAQRTAKLFREFAPLRAYTLDIAGSCAGIASFMVVSWLQIPAWAWYLWALAITIVAAEGAWKVRWLPVVPALLTAFLAHQQDARLLANPKLDGQLDVAWSPYQKVEFTENGRRIYVNGVSHQSMEAPSRIRSTFYQTIYTDRGLTPEMRPYRNVLVLGAGSGNDVAAALMNGAQHVDAVEIDPVIARFGRDHHPAAPYRDPRVNLVVDDGRAFMTRATRQYDLVIFALTDSLVKVSSMSQLRLENYLFTVESVRRAYEILDDGGDLVFYNHYRHDWLKEKIQHMALQATNRWPEQIFQENDFAVLRVRKGSNAAPTQVAAGLVDVPTDDWPFLYLLRHGIPKVYGWAIITVFVLIAALLAAIHFTSRRRTRAENRHPSLGLKLAFVFMGIAFLLLETKSIIQFSLLFGTTWINNSLVFLAVLLLVLAANWTALLLKAPTWLPLVGVLLIASSLAAVFFPLSELLAIRSSSLRFVAASLMTFSPIFFANLVFSIVFRDQTVAEHLFGWNLFGATLGGILEYASMLTGYRFLAIAVATCYAAVFVCLRASRPVPQTGTSAAAD
ncbi:MAG: hypothetical protein V2A73_12090 [Pseudomonadota bacterium]